MSNSTNSEIPSSIAAAMAQSAAASLEELRASRKEIRLELQAHRIELQNHVKEINLLREEVRGLRTEILPVLKSYSRHLDLLQDEHTEAISEARDAKERLQTSIASALTSNPAMAVWGAAGTALAGVLARYLGMF